MSSLSNETVKNLKATGQDYRVRDKAGKESGYHGFGVKVTAAGNRSFFLEYSMNGKRRFMPLGHYPAKSLKVARSEAKDARALVDMGIDPQLEREKQAKKQEAERKRLEREKKERETAVTVDGVLDYYLEGVSENTRSDAERLFKNRFCDVRKQIGEMKLREVTDEMIEELIDTHVQRGKLRNAGKLFAYMRAAFSRGKKHKPFMLKKWSNPFDTVDKPENTDSNAVDRALSKDEIRQFWSLLGRDKIKMLPGTVAIMKILLLTGQRVEQTSRMRWTDIDLVEGVWDVPATETKGGKQSKVGHVVPLTPLAIEIIKSMPVYAGEDFVFPGIHGGKPFSISGMSNPLKKLLQTSKIESFTPRDLRRTCTTQWSKLGILAEVRNRIQDHSLGGVEAKHYDRHDYLKEKREALEKWERELNRIISVKSESNVVEMRA
jgi:integrase